MRQVFERWLISAAINFILRQVAKFTTETNWSKVGEDLAERVKDLIPGTWFDEEAASILKCILVATERALKTPKSIEKILNLLAQENYPEAADALKIYLIKAWTAEDFLNAVKEHGKIEVASKAKGLLEEYKPLA